MSRWLFIFFAGFAGGIALRSFFPAGGGSALGGDFAFALFLILLGFILLIYHLYHSNILKNVRMKSRSIRSRSSAALFVALFILSVGLGVLRFDVADLNKGSGTLDANVGEEVLLGGIVVDEPDVRENHTKLTVLIQRICRQLASADCVEVEGSKALLVVEHYPQFQYGDEIQIEGVLKKPRNFQRDQNEPGRPFNYVAYLAKDKIFYQIFYPHLILVAHKKGNPIRQVLFSLKRALVENASRIIPEPHVSLLAGITVGAKQALGEQLLDAFRRTGIIHIVVLSGYNVTIVADAIGRFFSFFPRLIGISASASAIVLFALLAGSGATVVRASIMALLVLLARTTGRAYEITIALFVAGFLMLLWNPKILIFDPSFQLSFLATLGLLYIAPQLERHLGFLPTKWQLREFAMATIATQIFVLPLLLYMMGELSVVAVIVNLLILPFIAPTMLFGFLTALAGFVHIALSLPFAYMSYFLLAYELKVVDLFAALPFASITIQSFSAWFMLAIYAFYGWLIYRIAKYKGSQKK